MVFIFTFWGERLHTFFRRKRFCHVTRLYEWTRRAFALTPVSALAGGGFSGSVGVSKILKYYVKDFYATGKALSDELSCTQIGLDIFAILFHEINFYKKRLLLQDKFFPFRVDRSSKFFPFKADSYLEGLSSDGWVQYACSGGAARLFVFCFPVSMGRNIRRLESSSCEFSSNWWIQQ